MLLKDAKENFASRFKINLPKETGWDAPLLPPNDAVM